MPRMAYMPASNIWINYWTAWVRILHQMGLKRAYPDERVIPLALAMRTEFERLEKEQ